jgi:hypothetical protein
VVSYTVAQRTNEFGIRVALGAGRRDLLRIVFKSASVSLGAGVITGVALSLALSQFIARWVQGNPRDPRCSRSRSNCDGLGVRVGLLNTGTSRF